MTGEQQRLAATLRVTSPEWTALKRYLTVRLEESRRALETTRSHDTSQFLRGSILEIRNLIEEVERPTAASQPMPGDDSALY